MIKLPSKAEIEKLRSLRQPISVSMYASYIAPNSSTNPNRIQLKNLLKEARQLLLDRNISQREIDEILHPAIEMSNDHEFRPNFRHSLALFMSHNFFCFYRLPTEIRKSSVSINKWFKVQPIERLLNNNLPYFLLILAHNGVQLFNGDHYSLEKIEFQKNPSNLKEKLNIDEYPRERRVHTINTAIAGKGSDRFHGQYNKAQVDKDELLEYFRRIDRELHKMINYKKLPLIIVGVDYLLPLYRQANTYPFLLTEEIRGNLEHSPLDLIRNKAYRIIKRAHSEG